MTNTEQSSSARRRRTIAIVASVIVAVLWTAVPLSTAQGPGTDGLLVRRYQEDENFGYLMTARTNDSAYEVRLTAIVSRDAAGRFVEEYAWSDLVIDGIPRQLTPASRQFRQAVTLNGDAPFVFPDLSRLQPGLIGPVTDLLTFYADLFLAMHAGQLRAPGDRFLVRRDVPNSWADGTVVLVGEGAIDFDIMLTDIDRLNGVAGLVVKHVVPEEPAIQIPAAWMHAPVADTPNNWVQVRRDGDSYVAAVGQETFDVELNVSLESGRILRATMVNPVETVVRDCADIELADCGGPRRRRIFRRVEMLAAD